MPHSVWWREERREERKKREEREEREEKRREKKERRKERRKKERVRKRKKRIERKKGGNVNTIHLEPEIHEQIYVTKGYGTLCTTPSTFSLYIETIVTNKVNNATHADKLTMQQLSTLHAVCS